MAEKLDIELGLISAVLETGNMKEAVSKKIRPDFFQTAQKAVWEFMWKHYTEHKKAPDVASIVRKFPGFEPLNTTEPVAYFIKEIQERARYNMILRGLQQAGAKLEIGDPRDAEKLLVQLVSKLNTEINVSKDVLWNTDVDARKERLEYRMLHGGVDGISYGIEALDQVTGGMHKGELITIVGKSGTGKTYEELVIAGAAMSAGEDVLFISREMQGWQIEQRMDALHFRIPMDKLKLGQFTEEEKEDYFINLEKLKDQPLGRLIISSDDEKGFGIAAIQAKIEEHLPNGGVVIIDGSYLLDDDDNGKNNWEKITNITRNLKRLARRAECTIIQSSQMGRGQKRGKFGDGDAISFSSSFEQDSDIVIELFQTPEMKAAGKMGLHGLKVREGAQPTLILHWNFATMKDFGKLAIDATDSPPDEEEANIIC